MYKIHNAWIEVNILHDWIRNRQAIQVVHYDKSTLFLYKVPKHKKIKGQPTYWLSLFLREASGIRTHDIQNHNLTL